MNKRVAVCKEYYEYPKEGVLLTTVETNRTWAVVLWDGADDPDLFKYEGLEIIKDEN